MSYLVNCFLNKINFHLIKDNISLYYIKYFYHRIYLSSQYRNWGDIENEKSFHWKKFRRIYIYSTNDWMTIMKKRKMEKIFTLYNDDKFLLFKLYFNGFLPKRSDLVNNCIIILTVTVHKKCACMNGPKYSIPKRTLCKFFFFYLCFIIACKITFISFVFILLFFFLF